jgi:hypothetical protein
MFRDNARRVALQMRLAGGLLRRLPRLLRRGAR